MNCEIHGKKLDLYCKEHEMAVCVTCISSEHKSCSSSDVISIEKASTRAKQAAADLEELISRTLENFKYFINNQEIALENVDKDEQTIRKMIEDTRLNLNEYLNDLERKLLLDLRSKHANCQSQYTKSLSQLNQKRIEIENLKEQIIKMKHSASDIQVFLGTHQFNKAITEQIGSLKEDIRFHTDTSMKLEINPFINSFMEEVTQFGEIRVIGTNVGQAKTKMHGSKQNICNISLLLKQKFYIKGCEVPITGCIILSDYRIIFADYTGSMLMEYNNNGKHIRDIIVDHRPFDLAAVDTDRIVVSYGVSKYLEIINTNKENNRKKVECSDDCWRISYQDQKVCVIVDHQGIVIMDLEGKISTIIDIDVTHVLYLSTSIDRIYYTNFHNSTVHCCSMTGQELWAFNNRSMTYQRGLSVDSSQNVFVVGLMSNNLTVIRNDGVESKILLTDRDGLDCPYTVNYNKLKKIVCLGYTEGSVALYDVLEKETELKEANAV